MNILFLLICTLDPEKGGAERVCKNLADEWSKKGNNIYFLSCCRTSDVENEGQYYFPDLELVLCNENISFFEDFIHRFAINVVIVSQPLDQSNIMEFAHYVPKNVVVVSHLHNSPFGLFGYFGRIKKWKISSYRYVRKLALLWNRKKYRLNIDRMIQYSDKVVLLSESFKKELCFFNKDVKDKLVAISNPIFLKENEIQKKYKEIIYVGRINSVQKRFGDVLKIWKIVMNQLPDWKLIIVGGGDELNYYCEKSKCMHLDRISFEGFKSPDFYYKKATFLIMTSAYEGFGMVLVEAMQYACIPFAYDSFASISDIIDDQIDGVIVPPFDTLSYARQIVALANSSKIEEMQQCAIRKCSLFDASFIAEIWLKMLNNMLIRI